jgi:hypothetical protein
MPPPSPSRASKGSPLSSGRGFALRSTPLSASSRSRPTLASSGSRCGAPGRFPPQSPPRNGSSYGAGEVSRK